MVQRGSSEYLLLRGKARLLRRLASSNEYVYTRLGKTYYSQKEVSYLVHVPAVIKKAHSNSKGRTFQVPHNAFMDSDLKISVNLNDQKQALKARVLDFIKTLPTLNGIPILYQDSDPVLYDERGDWTFDEQTTVQEANGKMRTETTLDRPLGATPMLFDDITLPQGLCKEAFLDSKGNCVAVQLASLLKMPLDRVENEIDRIWKRLTDTDKQQYELDGESKTWRDLGVTAKMITHFGLENGMNVHIMSGGERLHNTNTTRGERRCASALQYLLTTLGFTMSKASNEVYPTKPCQTTILS